MCIRDRLKSGRVFLAKAILLAGDETIKHRRNADIQVTLSTINMTVNGEIGRYFLGYAREIPGLGIMIVFAALPFSIAGGSSLGGDIKKRPGYGP